MMCKDKMKLIGLVSAIAVLGISSFASGGKITTINNLTGTPGFGGWNLDNVEVLTFKDDLGTPTTGISFDEATGAYADDFLTFDSNIYGITAATSTPLLMGVLHGKDYPVGEPAGIKVISGDSGVKAPKPENCIMTTSYLDEHFLDDPEPAYVTCSSPFQTHKRFKVNMQPASLGAAVDLVFNVEANGMPTDYQMFQKMNNYTGKRLEGFIVQVGVGTGTTFQAANAIAGMGLGNLSIWASEKTGADPETGIWDEKQIATFSHGLFGPIDQHFPEEGFFDNRTAGFLFSTEGVWPKMVGEGDTLQSGKPMDNNYAELPIPNFASNPTPTQFGPWLHSAIAPKGIFFDDDADPSTDNQLMAFWGDVNGNGTTFAWMRGQIDDFALVEPSLLSAWDADPLYTIDTIEDMLNLGLNYVVTVGAVDSAWPTYDGTVEPARATFTIRMIPVEDTTNTADPDYVANPPSGIIPDRGTVHVAASPTFNIGDLLTITVADSNVLGVPGVVIENLNNSDIENAVVMTEISSGYFSGTISTSNDANHGVVDGVLYVQPGDVIKVTYSDSDPVNDVFFSTTGEEETTTFYMIPMPNGGAVIGL